MSDAGKIDIHKLKAEVLAMKAQLDLIPTETELETLVERLRDLKVDSNLSLTDLRATKSEEMEIRTEIGLFATKWQKVRRKHGASAALMHLARKLNMEVKDLSDHVRFAQLPDLFVDQHVEDDLTWPMIRQRIRTFSKAQLDCELGVDPTQF